MQREKEKEREKESKTTFVSPSFLKEKKREKEIGGERDRKRNMEGNTAVT